MRWDITGIGAVASIGSNPHQIFDALCKGHTGLAQLRGFDLSKYRAHHAYEIDDRQQPGRDESGRATRWLAVAIEQALADAGLTFDADVPILIGTTLREQRTVELWWRDGMPMTPANLRFGPALGSTGSHTFANACAASLYTLGLATDMIALGLADTVVVAGTDSITESAFGTLDQVQSGVPDTSSPFDRARRGMLMGEGAVAAVVQRPGTHNRSVHARVRAVSMNCDARHPTAPAPDSITEVILEAFERGQVTPDDIDLVMLHGSGTQLNDAVEATALSRVFGPMPDPWMTAIKSMTGHTLGGSGLLSLIVATLSMTHGVVPPIHGLTEPLNEGSGFRLVRDQAASANPQVAQVDAFGFGGINAVAVVERAS